MRITNKMLSMTTLNNLNKNLARLDEYQKQNSSGVKVNVASDDPVAAAKILKAKSAMNSQEQYSANLKTAKSYLSTVSDALSGAYDILDQVRENAVAGANATNSDSSMQALGDHVNSLIEGLIEIANTNYNGSYVFGGGRTKSEPFATTKGADGNVTQVQFISSTYTDALLDQTYSQSIEISAGVTINLAAGAMTFHTDSDGATGLNAVFNTLIDLRDALNSGNSGTVGTYLGELDGFLDNVTSEEAVVGAKINRIETAQNRSTVYTSSLKTFITGLENVDIAEAYTKYSSAYATYQASLSVAAQVLTPSLLDFLN